MSNKTIQTCVVITGSIYKNEPSGTNNAFYMGESSGMNSWLDMPLLAKIPKMKLAKLMSDVEEECIEAGRNIDIQNIGQYMHFIVEGEIQLLYFQEQREVPLKSLRSGELFGDSDLIEEIHHLTLRTITPVRLCRFPLLKFQNLVQSEPHLAQEYIRLTNMQSVRTLQDLTRAKIMLAAYTDALWHEDPTPPTSDVAASIAVHERLPIAGKPSALNALPQKLGVSTVVRYVCFAVSFIGAWTLYRLQSGDQKLAAVSAVLLWATLNWLLNIMPDFVVGLTAATGLVLFGVASPSTAFSGFASSSWFLLLGAGGLGVAVYRSGLLYRVALHMLRLLPSSYRGQSFALAVTGVIFTPLMPSANSRVAMASPLARELSDAMRFPELSNGSTGLAMSTFLGFGLMYFMFMNGSNTSLLAWSLLPKALQQQVTWGSWLVMALPLGIFLFTGCFLAVMYLYPPEPTAGVSRQTILSQLQVLGPMTRMERFTAGVLILVLLGFITQPLHGVDPSWLALGGFIILTGFNVIRKAELKEIDWNFLLLFGTLISLSDVTKSVGLAKLLGRFILPILQPLGASPYLFLGAIAVITLLVRLMVPLQPTVLLMIISLVPVSVQMSYNPFSVALVVLALSNNWFVPQQNSVYLGVYSATEERAFTHSGVRKLALAHALVGVLAVLASVPIWQWLGLVPT